MILSRGLRSFRGQLSVLQSEPAGKRFIGDDAKLREAGSGTGSAPVCSYPLYIRQASRVGFHANSPPGSRVIGQEIHRS